VIEVENVPETADAERVMESMIKQGAKLIVAASFGYLDPAPAGGQEVSGCEIRPILRGTSGPPT